MAWSSPESFRLARTTALGRLKAAQHEFVEGIAPKLDESQQRALYDRVMADPALFDRVLKKYGREGVLRWQNAMQSKLS